MKQGFTLTVAVNRSKVSEGTLRIRSTAVSAKSEILVGINIVAVFFIANYFQSSNHQITKSPFHVPTYIIISINFTLPYKTILQ